MANFDTYSMHVTTSEVIQAIKKHILVFCNITLKKKIGLVGRENILFWERNLWVQVKHRPCHLEGSRACALKNWDQYVLKGELHPNQKLACFALLKLSTLF